MPKQGYKISASRNHPPDYEQHLQDALEALRNDSTLSIAKAAANQGVPASTVRDRKNKGCQNPKSAHYQEYLLSLAQEEALVKWALFQDDIGISPCQELLKKKVEAILYLSNSKETIGKS